MVGDLKKKLNSCLLHSPSFSKPKGAEKEELHCVMQECDLIILSCQLSYPNVDKQRCWWNPSAILRKKMDVAISCMGKEGAKKPYFNQAKANPFAVFSVCRRTWDRL